MSKSAQDKVEEVLRKYTRFYFTQSDACLLDLYGNIYCTQEHWNSKYTKKDYEELWRKINAQLVEHAKFRNILSRINGTVTLYNKKYWEEGNKVWSIDPSNGHILEILPSIPLHFENLVKEVKLIKK